MTEIGAAKAARSLFRRDTKGRTIGPIAVQVERGRIQFFASVLGEIDPIHFDVNAARAKGYPDIVAPASFLTVIEAIAYEELRRRGLQSTDEIIGCDLRYVLHGDETYTYHGLIYAGDEVVVTGQVLDFYDKKGGALEFATYESTVAHAERGVLVTALRTVLHKLPQ